MWRILFEVDKWTVMAGISSVVDGLGLFRRSRAEMNKIFKKSLLTAHSVCIYTLQYEYKYIL